MNAMIAISAIEEAQDIQSVREIPLSKICESKTNPRRHFDEPALKELAENIKQHGILQPVLVRPLSGGAPDCYELVAGARRYRACKLAKRDSIPATVRELTDAQALELQIIENVQRAEMHPFEEAQGFDTLLKEPSGKYSVERLAAKIGKRPEYVAERLKLLELTQSAAKAFLANRITLGHALLIAKLTPETQESALEHCFDSFGAGSEDLRSLVPLARLKAWVEQNVYLTLKRVPFSKDDESLVPEAGSCAACPKRTGANILLFSDALDDACTDGTCFNRKLNAHIARRLQKTTDLVQISSQWSLPADTAALSRRNYAEVIARRNGNKKQPESRLCSNAKTAIYLDGIDKGRLTKVCADPFCKIHFHQQQEEQRRAIQDKARRKAEKKRQKTALTHRNVLFSEVLKKVKPDFGTEELRLIARFVLSAISHDQIMRLAKHHNLVNPKNPRDWQAAEKARLLYENANAPMLAGLILEAMLIGAVPNTTASKENDLLATAAHIYKIDVKAVRIPVVQTDSKPQPVPTKVKRRRR